MAPDQKLTPDVSVVIPARNAAQVLPTQLKALAGSEGAPAFEVVIVDNGSTDGTACVAWQWADRFPCGLRVVRASDRKGVSYARNVGIEAARTEKILICDADDVVSSTWVREFAAALEGADVVGSSVRHRRGATVVRETGPLHEALGQKDRPYALGSSRGIRREAWKRVGGFDESYPAGHEEVDFDWRIHDAGLMVRGVPEASIDYQLREREADIRRQYRGYAQGSMLLWTRYCDELALPPISLIGSLRSWPRAWARLAAARLLGRPLEQRADAAQTLGWVEGTVSGHLRYRFLGTVPPRRLYTVCGSAQGSWMGEGRHAAAQLVTVIIPHYGDPAPTLTLITQLEQDESLKDVPVVVVDDASPIPFPAETQPSRQRIRVIRREENRGFGTAVNTGLDQTGTPWALVLNSDLNLTPGHLEQLVREAADHDRTAVWSPEVLGEDGRTQWPGRHFPTVRQQTAEWLTPLARFRDRGRVHELVGHDTRTQVPAVHEVDWVFGAAMLLPVDAVRNAGGFDERFFMNAEEVDLQRRLRDRGIPSMVDSRLHVIHVGGGSSNPGLRRRWLVASRFLYARKWGGERRLRAALRAATLVNLGHQTLRRAAGRDVAPLRTFREEWALTGLSERGANQ